MEIAFENLPNADLIVDTVYKGGNVSGKGSEVLSKLMPGCSNSGGFRKVLRKDGSGLPAYVVLYTSMQELAWPDYLDEETGIFRYYGDNRSPGKTILDTPRKGNQLLEFVFDCLNSRDGAIKNIPPFFIFKKTGCGWDVKFLGLAAPGNPKISPDKDLVAFWRTMNEERFQNYEAYFTVLETEEAIDRRWLHALVYDHENSLQFAPETWKRFMQKGRNGIVPLIAKKIIDVPTKYEQLQSDNEGQICLQRIREYYKQFPQGFENCAKDLLEKSGFITNGNYVIHPEKYNAVFEKFANFEITTTDDYVVQYQLLGKLYMLFSEIMSKENVDTKEKSNYVDLAIKYMNLNYSKNISIELLSKVIGVERTYFYRIFKEATKMGPKEYLSSLRIEKAKMLLCNTNMNIKEVALQVGFSNYLSFVRTFSEKNGMSPTLYRKKNR